MRNATFVTSAGRRMRLPGRTCKAAMRAARLRAVVLLALLALAGRLAAAEPAREPIPPPPPPPEEEGAPPEPEGAPFEPEIRITTRDGAIFEEYRYNGILYRVKVTPRYGPPYYLIYDEFGDVHRSDAEPKILVPQWVVKRF